MRLEEVKWIQKTFTDVPQLPPVAKPKNATGKLATSVDFTMKSINVVLYEHAEYIPSTFGIFFSLVSSRVTVQDSLSQ